MSSEMRRTFHEIRVVSLYTDLSEAFGTTMPYYDSWLPMPRPPHVGRYRALSKLRVHFGESPLPEVRTVLDAAVLDLPRSSPVAVSRFWRAVSWHACSAESINPKDGVTECG